MQLLTLQKSDLQLNTFLEKANEAYKARSNESVPFTPITAQDIKNNEQIFVVMDGEEMVSGCCIDPFQKNAVRLQHVWSDVNKTRKGYASFLVDEVEKCVKQQGWQQLKLGVMSAYMPAYKLYKKKGWKAYAVVANEPKTYYTISMVKYLAEKGKIRFEIKRSFGYLFSKIKFFLLFKTDSTPTWLYKLIYKK